MEKFESEQNTPFSVILGHTLNVILRFIPRIHTKHLANVILGLVPRIHTKHPSLDTRVKPEYDADLMMDTRVKPEYDRNLMVDTRAWLSARPEDLDSRGKPENDHNNLLPQCAPDTTGFLSDVYKRSTRAQKTHTLETAESGVDKVVSSCEKNPNVHKAYMNFLRQRKTSLDAPLHAVSSGRSMIEMLGVLAIIGVLSVGGIAGYSKAMMKFKINKTAEQISQIVTNIRTLYLQQKDYNGLGNSSAIQMGAIPDDLTIDSSGNIKNIFGGTIWIHTSTSSYAWHNSVGDTDDAFIITIYNLPKEACVALATMDWGTFSTGLIAVSVNDDGFSNSTYNFPKCNGYSEQRYVAGCPGDSTVSVPIPVSLAATACNYWSSPNFNLMFY